MAAPSPYPATTWWTLGPEGFSEAVRGLRERACHELTARGTQPVAAGPTNVGEYVPRLDEVTAAARVARALTLEFAAADTPKVTSSVTTIDRGQ